jgi:outer membrane lipoprotein-sorting protein
MVRISAPANALRAAIVALGAAFALNLPDPAAAAPTRPPAKNAAALVHAALDAPKHISYVGQIQTVRFGTKVATATVQRVEHRAPASTRRTFLAPESLYGEYDITLGTQTTKFDPKHSRVLTVNHPRTEGAGGDDNTLLLASNYRAVIGPVEVVAARPATTVSLVNKFTGERAMRLWIDNATNVVLAKEAYHTDGSLAWRMRFDEIRYTNEIPRDLFSTQIPSGFSEIEGHHFNDMSTDFQRTLDAAGFGAVGPHILPDGFSLIGSEVSIVNGVKNVHLLYSDGIRTLSLFENNAGVGADFGTMKPQTAHFDGHDAQYAKDGPTTLFTWRDHGIAFALVGDFDIRELTQIASSVQP